MTTDEKRLEEIREKYDREGVLRDYEIAALFQHIETLQQELRIGETQYENRRLQVESLQQKLDKRGRIIEGIGQRLIEQPPELSDLINRLASLERVREANDKLRSALRWSHLIIADMLAPDPVNHPDLLNVKCGIWANIRRTGVPSRQWLMDEGKIDFAELTRHEREWPKEG